MRNFLFFITMIFSIAGFANGLEITNLSYDEVEHELTFDITWENPWNEFTSYPTASSDGVWIFVKYAPNGGPSWQHLNILSATTSLTGLNTTIGNNNRGVMLIPSLCLGIPNCVLGTFTVTLELDNTIGVSPDFKVFGMEMVHVPTEAYYLGDGGYSNYTFHTYPDTLDPYLVDSSTEIICGFNSGNLQKKIYGLNFTIPAEYPKGYRAFWVMKYKVTMEQYVEFLNTLNRIAQNKRTETDVSGNSISNTYVMTNSSAIWERNPIRCDAIVPASPISFYCDLDGDGVGNESNDGQNLIARHISINDYLAYLDWSAMRPMSKMEFEKMCRGPLNPVAGEYGWGSSTYEEPGNITNPGEASESFDNVGSGGPIWPNFSSLGSGARAGFRATPTSDRLSAGATFYGIQDVHCGHEYYVGESSSNVTSFDYFNSQGNGELGPNGNANVPTWNIEINFAHTLPNFPISDGTLFYTDENNRSSTGTCRGVVRLSP